MVADVMHRSNREHVTSERLLAKARADNERVRRIAEQIRRMTQIYIEREAGKRVR